MTLESFRNTFAGGPLDRMSGRRDDAAWLAERLASPDALLLALRDGEPLVEDGPQGPRLAYAAADACRALAADRERLLFLGLWKEAAVFALDVESADDRACAALLSLGRFEPLRELAAVLAPAESAMAGTARAVFEWRRRNRFCANCGARTEVAGGGWKRLCPACGAQHFPRLDPVVIMLPVRGERCLLGRQAPWPPGRYSALAGFVEPGESVDEACAREVREECGLVVERVRPHSTQPWPFPHSLMLGLIADVAEGEARPVDGELEAVRWASRAEVRRMLMGEEVDGVSLPPPLAIARRLVEAWALAEG
ncbi:MAG: NAD(+) diphosphatase [Caulobacteraceae bacterium]|nr:NAD(+) diphosphatase [Caulobacter sp.]